MVELLATGHTWSGGGGPITWAPVAGLLLTLVLARSVLSLRLSPLTLGTSVLLGTLFAIGAETWGVTMTTSAWIVGALIVSGRIRHTFGRNPSD